MKEEAPMTENAIKSAEIIKKRLGDLRPELAIALGSGLGVIVDEIEDVVSIDYHDLPGFHRPGVEGHGGHLYFGRLNGLPVGCVSGRAHFYEGIPNEVVQTMTRTMKLLGCQTWLATNASGSLNKEVTPGELVLIKDHINFQFRNVLTGPNDDRFGPRFIGVENLYDADLREQIKTLAKENNIHLTEGVYFGVLGPSFETPAEIRAYKMLGADVIGMSTIPEVLSAYHCGMKIAVIAAITNLAAGMHHKALSHEETLAGAKLGSEKLVKLVTQFCEERERRRNLLNSVR